MAVCGLRARKPVVYNELRALLQKLLLGDKKMGMLQLWYNQLVGQLVLRKEAVWQTVYQVGLMP